VFAIGVSKHFTVIGDSEIVAPCSITLYFDVN